VTATTTEPVTVLDVPLAPHRDNPVHPLRIGTGYQQSMHDYDKNASPWIAAIPNAAHGRYARYSIHHYGRQSVSRRVHAGPLLPGPYAYLVPQCAVIDNYGGSGAEAARNRAAGLEFDAKAGDVWQLGGDLWQVRLHRYDGPNLVLLYPEQGARR
jgi:hypothetical protein